MEKENNFFNLMNCMKNSRRALCFEKDLSAMNNFKYNLYKNLLLTHKHYECDYGLVFIS